MGGMPDDLRALAMGHWKSFQQASAGDFSSELFKTTAPSAFLRHLGGCLDFGTCLLAAEGTFKFRS